MLTLMTLKDLYAIALNSMAMFAGGKISDLNQSSSTGHIYIVILLVTTELSSVLPASLAISMAAALHADGGAKNLLETAMARGNARMLESAIVITQSHEALVTLLKI